MIAVVDYHKGNLKSVERGLITVGAEAQITADPAVIAQADAVVLPGVGAFADAMAGMSELGQVDAILERIAAGAPFLGICLGQQLLFAGGSEGAPDGETVPGLGLLPGIADRLPNHDEAGTLYKIPHVGWNSIEAPGAAPGDAFANPLFAGIPQGEHFYFTHSYVAPESPYTAAVTTHSTTFPSAVWKDNVFGVQFHPEKSSDAGLHVLRNFAAIVASRA